MKDRQDIEESTSAGDGLSVAPERRPTDDSGDVFVFPTSFAQQRLWFLQQLDPDNPAYNVSVAFRLKGRLQVKALERSLREIARRHETLRTTFSIRAGQPVQVIAASRPLPLSVVDLREHPEAARQGEAQQRISREVHRPLDLSTGPLWRVVLLRTGEEEHLLLFIMHHIISDGWSLGILARELSALYQAAAAGRPSSLPEPTIQYADFAVWQRDWLQGEILEEQLACWRERLAGAPTALKLPTDHPRPAVWTHGGARRSRLLPRDMTAALRELSHNEKATLFMTLLAAFAVLLHRYTGQDHILIGTPIANRNRSEIEGLIGFFVNTLVIRADLSGNPCFRDALARLRDVCLEAYDHQDLPFERLVEELRPERQLNQSPLIQVTFALDDKPRQMPALPGLEVSLMEVEGKTAKFDLSLSVVETAEGLRATCEYRTDLFKEATIARLLGHYQKLLEGILADPDQPIGALPLLTEGERHQLLVDWNDTETEFPKDRCIHQLFEAQVEGAPENIAVLFKDHRLTYRELNRQANRLAHYLIKRDVGPEAVVGICLERSPEMIVAVLGVLKAGGAFLPLDPDAPRARLAHMLEASSVSLLLTRHLFRERFSEQPVQPLCVDTDHDLFAGEADDNPPVRATAENLAYVIYTSGSTGAPKGVMIEHRGLVNVSLASVKNFGLHSENCTMLHQCSPAFDNSVWEIFMALLAGATLCLAGPEAMAGPGLGRLLRDRAITHAVFVPSALATVPPGAYPALRTLLVGAESCPPELIKIWSPGRRFFNTYGPTEASIHVALFEYSATYPYGFPIGRPIQNTRFYILDRHLQPVPIGVPGELYIGGVGLARGYLDQPELTARAFIPDPFSREPEARLYKTGDLVRYLPDGNIELLGRIDQQIKIRGFRIEPGEIEAALGQHPAVREAVVLAREDSPGDKRLVAYVVLEKDQIQDPGQLRAFLRERLPEYMVPSAFVPLDTLPLNPSGKLDRRALPPPPRTRADAEEAYTAPRTPTEQTLAGIWSRTLGIEPVGIHDNFFELGGHSLLATQILSRIREAFSLELPLRSLFETPTVRGLAASIETILSVARNLETPPASQAGERREGSP